MLHNFLPYYPDSNRNDIQKLLFNSAEFFEKNSTKEIEQLEKKGDFYKHQEYLARHFLNNNRIFNISVPGSGKTGQIVASIEEVFSKTKLYSQAIIATTSSLTNNINEQILCELTDGSYLTKREDGNFTSNKEFNSKYKIISHDELLKMFGEKGKGDSFTGYTIEKLSEIFSYKMLFIDEVSEILTNDFITVNPNNKTLFQLSNKIPNFDLLTLKNLNDVNIRNSNLLYVQLMRLLLSCPTVKFMDLTGTPINNFSPDFFLLANLTLDFQNLYNINKICSNITNLTLEDFQRLNGKIFYIGDSSSVAEKKYEGELFNYYHNINNELIKSQMVLYPIEVYSVQADSIFKEKNSNIIQLQKLPNFSYVAKDGTTSMNADIGENNGYIMLMDQNKITNLNQISDQMETSSIFTNLVLNERNKINSGQRGVFVVYNELSKTSIKPLLKLFKIYNFEVLDKEDLFFSENTKKTFCRESNITISRLLTESPNGRVIFIENTMSDKVKEEILRITYSEQNVRGNHIAGIIITPAMQMGYSIGNVDRFYRLYASWTWKSKDQSDKRALRLNSHVFKKKYGIDPQVLYRYYCSYCEYYYIDQEDFEPLFQYNNNLLENNRIMSHSICYLVGFIDKNDYHKISGIINEFYYNVAETYENLYDKIIEKFKICPIYDINLISDEKYLCLFLKNGLFCLFDNKTLYEDLRNINSILIDRYQGTNFLMDIPGIYDSFYFLPLNGEFIYKKCSREVFSVHFDTYMSMEFKNIMNSKIMYFVIQIAANCLSSYIRNNYPKEYDYTPECNYTLCDYKCSSQIFDEKEEKVIKDGELFWDNKEILYFRDIVNDCKRKIYGILNEKKKEKINNIFSYFHKEGKRDYFIFLSIYELLYEKQAIYDNYGLPCYISINETELFLSRDITINNSTKNNFFNNNELILTNGKIDFKKKEESDNLFSMAYSLPYVDDINQGLYLLDKFLSDKLFSFRAILLEDVILRKVINEIYPGTVQIYNVDQYVLKRFEKFIILDDVYYHIYPKEEIRNSGHNKKIGVSKIKEARKLIMVRGNFEWIDLNEMNSSDNLNRISEYVKNKTKSYYFNNSYFFLDNGQIINSDYFLIYEEDIDKSKYKFVSKKVTKYLGGTEISSVKKTTHNEILHYFGNFMEYLTNNIEFTNSYYDFRQSIGSKSDIINNKMIRLFYSLNLVLKYEEN